LSMCTALSFADDGLLRVPTTLPEIFLWNKGKARQPDHSGTFGAGPGRRKSRLAWRDDRRGYCTDLLGQP
jgi:hypothetical protein